MARAIRGFSLVELTVAIALGATLLLVADRLFQGAGQALRKIQVAGTVQSTGSLAMDRLTQELRRSAYSQLTVEATPCAVSFRSADADAPMPTTFTPLPYFVIYHVQGSELRRKTWPRDSADQTLLSPNPVTENRRMTPAEIATVLASGLSQDQVLARHVTFFACQPTVFPTPTVTDRLQFDMVIDQDGTGMSFSTACTPRNGN